MVYREAPSAPGVEQVALDPSERALLTAEKRSALRALFWAPFLIGLLMWILFMVLGFSSVLVMWMGPRATDACLTLSGYAVVVLGGLVYLRTFVAPYLDHRRDLAEGHALEGIGVRRRVGVDYVVALLGRTVGVNRDQVPDPGRYRVRFLLHSKTVLAVSRVDPVLAEQDHATLAEEQQRDLEIIFRIDEDKLRAYRAGVLPARERWRALARAALPAAISLGLGVLGVVGFFVGFATTPMVLALLVAAALAWYSLDRLGDALFGRVALTSGSIVKHKISGGETPDICQFIVGGVPLQVPEEAWEALRLPDRSYHIYYATRSCAAVAIEPC